MYRGVIAHGAQGMDNVGRDVYKVTLTDLTLLITYLHNSSAIEDIIKLVGWM